MIVMTKLSRLSRNHFLVIDIGAIGRSVGHPNKDFIHRSIDHKCLQLAQRGK